jgi:ribose transport system substrate-binding protein
MRNILTTTSVMATLAAMLAMAGLTGSVRAPAHAADLYRFAIVPKAMNNPYFDLARDGCEAEAKKLGVTCTYTGPVEQDPAAQVQIIQDLISQHVDGIAISVADAASVKRVIHQARQAGIVVITFDADSPDSERQAYVGTDNAALGRALGQMLLKAHPKPGPFAIVSGGPAAANLAQRVEGVRAVLKPAGWTEIGGSPTFCNDDSALGVQQMTDLMTANPSLAAIVPVGGWPLFTQGAFTGFVNSHKQAITSGSFSIVSADTLPVELHALQVGQVSGLVGQRPREMGEKAVDIMLALKKGQAQPITTYAGLDEVTKENVARFAKP